MTTSGPTQLTVGPIGSAQRSLAPDLARGGMLLLIALANAAGAFLASAPGVDTTPHGWERGYNIVLFTLVHSRAFPLFAIMFGYGLVQLAQRQAAAGQTVSEVRRLMIRRNGWLIAFGAAHGILLYSGDFLAAYGIVGIAFTLLLLRRTDRTYRLVPWYLAAAVCYLVVLAVLVITGIMNSTIRGAVPVSPFPSMTVETYTQSLAARLVEWPLNTLTVLPILLFVWVGAWAGRLHILDHPELHRRLLRAGAAGGICIGIAGGLPMGLFTAGYIHPDTATTTWIKLLYETAGLFGAIGYACLFGLLAASFVPRSPAKRTTTDGELGLPRATPIVVAVAALGQRSLSGYLFQSALWLLLVPPFALDLAQMSPSPTFTAAACAVAAWIVSLIIADIMRRRGHRGPAENLLRHLTYGRREMTSSPRQRMTRDRPVTKGIDE